jgi:hypothetical protein
MWGWLTVTLMRTFAAGSVTWPAKTTRLDSRQFSSCRSRSSVGDPDPEPDPIRMFLGFPDTDPLVRGLLMIGKKRKKINFVPSLQVLYNRQ